MIKPSNCQHVGKRKSQEDAFALLDFSDKGEVNKNGFLVVVADGMGGLSCGEEASNKAVQVFIREYKQRKESVSIVEALWCSLRIANTAVFDLAYDGLEEKDLGTTLIATVVDKDQLHWVSAGDSRIYLFRNNSLKQLTRDHIYGNHLQLDVASGRLSQKEANNHPERNHLTSYLGLPEIPETDQSVKPLTLQNEDIIILSTDGLYDTLSESEIITVLKNNTENPAERLVKKTLTRNNKYQDNITVVTLSVLMLNAPKQVAFDEGSTTQTM